MKIFYFTLLIALVMPRVMFAQGGSNPPVGGGSNPPIGGGSNPGSGGGGTQPTGGGSVSITNPLQFDTITDFFLALLQVLLIFAVPIIVFFIIFAGFQYVTARGNAEQIQKATRALTYAIIGGLLILGAQVILSVIQGTVNEFLR